MKTKKLIKTTFKLAGQFQRQERCSAQLLTGEVKDGAEEMLEGILAGLFQSQQALMKAQNPQIQEAQETQSR